jgi:hypothetical protein
MSRVLIKAIPERKNEETQEHDLGLLPKCRKAQPKPLAGIA